MTTREIGEPLSNVVRRVAVVGAGTMGHAIGLSFAQAGFPVVLNDTTRERLVHARERIDVCLHAMVARGRLDEGSARAALARVQLSPSLPEAVREADLVIESVFEDRDLKRKVFRELDALCEARTILASNTSEIVPSTFASATRRPDRVVTAHYFYPAHLLPLVEVVPCAETSPETVAAVVEALEATGKTPLVLRREVPGFIANRLQVALLREALHMVARGIATPEEIDRAVTLSFGRRLGRLGLFEIIHLQGGSWTIDDELLRDLCSSVANSPIAGRVQALLPYNVESREDSRARLEDVLVYFQSDAPAHKTRR